MLADPIITCGSEHPLATKAGEGWVSLWDTLQGWVLVMLHQGRVPFPWSSLCCRSWALPCSSRIKLSKEFLFNLVVVQYFFPQSHQHQRSHQPTLLQPAAVAALQGWVCQTILGTSPRLQTPRLLWAGEGAGAAKSPLCHPRLFPAPGHFPWDINHCFRAWFCCCFSA